ncbi:hypothetical protein [Streptomyces spectabilis]|uniref:Holin n=1 Tax=Streptomyces spectabilis TaxID=68270 RepID=A0A5P2XER3_STRST|nr:hypothetical protein [Streptomyces spectabilis]MBB5108121.1 hypothetical protein [Streptomyces spectabilis]MCI3904344.1 hypothetical protein [Streptomyces spectabilis]QEV61450.1 hypothetical protein CP982_24370 [Streptomyces spectabilis]GGV26650.1 hypothetical protein GCM10010245_43760 [Streptomyces spectabilis]
MNDTGRRALRTLVQTLFGLVTALPLLADDPAARGLPGIAVAVAVAGALSRLMSAPAVERLLPAWLRVRTGPPPGEEADHGRL